MFFAESIHRDSLWGVYGIPLCYTVENVETSVGRALQNFSFSGEGKEWGWDEVGLSLCQVPEQCHGAMAKEQIQTKMLPCDFNLDVKKHKDFSFL